MQLGIQSRMYRKNQSGNINDFPKKYFIVFLNKIQSRDGLCKVAPPSVFLWMSYAEPCDEHRKLCNSSKNIQCNKDTGRCECMPGFMVEADKTSCGNGDIFY